MKTQRGLTLSELVMAVSIVAILTTLAMPSFTENVRQNRLRAAINEFSMALRLTQSEAIKRGKTVVICKSSNPEATTAPACGLSTDTAINWENGWVMFVDDDVDSAIDTTETIIRRGSPLRAGATLRGSSGASSSMVYQATGETTGPGTFVLCENNDITHARAIFFGINGRIHLAHRASSGAPADDSGTALSASACLSP